MLAIIAVQLTSYYLNALYYRSILKLFGYSVSKLKLFEAALATNFVNYIAPTAGAAGAGLLSQILKPEVPRGQGVLTQIMRYAFSGLAVLVMMPVGIVLILLKRSVNPSVDRVAILSAIAILVLALLILLLVDRERLLNKTLNRIAGWLERKFSKFNRANFDHFVRDFYRGYHQMKANKNGLLEPFGWSIFYIVVEILTVYLSFLAFGKVVNPGVAVMGYLLANISSILGGTLFSTGIFELGMIGTFVALGTPFSLALSVTVVYRVLNLLIGLPAGFFYYRKSLRKTKVVTAK